MLVLNISVSSFKHMVDLHFTAPYEVDCVCVTLGQKLWKPRHNEPHFLPTAVIMIASHCSEVYTEIKPPLYCVSMWLRSGARWTTCMGQVTWAKNYFGHWDLGVVSYHSIT